MSAKRFSTVALGAAVVAVCLLADQATAGAQAASQPTEATDSPSPDNNTYNEAWRWVRFTTESELPSNRVLDVVETPHGTVWASTRQGIASYDGFRWHAMGPEHGIPAEAPRKVVAYGSDELLVVIGKRLYRGNIDRFFEVPVEVDGARLDAVTLIPGGDSAVVLAAEAAEGLEALVSSDDLPLAEILPYTYRNDRFALLAPTAALPTEQDVVTGWGSGTGAIWLNTTTGLDRWDGDAWTKKMRAPVETTLGVARLIETPGGEWGLISVTHPPESRGLWEWNAHGELHRNLGEPRELLESMDISPRGDAVAVYRSGDVRIRRDGVWTALLPVPPQMANVTFVKFRPNGDLWVGSQQGLFLFRCTLDRWTHWEEESPSGKNEINDLLRTRDGSLWLATARGIVVHHPDGTVEPIERVLGEQLAGVTGLAEDAEGGIWISGGSAIEGAYRRDGEGWKHFGLAEGLMAPRVHRIRKDRRGHLWFLGMAPMAGFSGDDNQPGAFMYDGESFTPWGTDQGLLHGRVYDFAESTDGALWFATLRGLSRWRDDDWTHWTRREGLRKRRIFSIAVGDDGVLWFGDQGSGLGRMENDVPGYLTSRNGLIQDEVQEVRFDSNGRLWVSTSGGLACLHDGTWLHFDAAAGLSNPRLWPILPTDDAIYVGTKGNGVDILRLDEAANPSPTVELAAPLVEGNSGLLRWVTYAYWGELPPSAIETRYRLVGDDDWSGWSTEREVELKNLPTGDYLFEIQAKGLFGGFEAIADSAPFSIRPPLYLRAAFIFPVGTLAFVVLALLGSIVSRRRRDATALREREDGHRRRLEQRVEERTEALRESEERLRMLLETTNVMPWEADAATWKFTYVGPQAVAILGYPVEEWYEPDFWTAHIHPDDVDYAVSYCDLHTKSSRKYDFEYRMIAADGRSVWLHDIVSVVSGSGKPVALRGFMIDITKRKQAEAERLVAESEALEHRERLAHMSRVNMLGEMATGIAHEVNQPLAAVTTYTQACRRMLEAGTMNERELVDVLSRISDEAVRAGDMIHGLKALVRKRPSELEACELNDLIRDVVRLAEVEARQQGVDLELDLHEPATPIVVDSVQIQQVVLNLVRNAIDAADGTHGRVRIRTFQNGDESVEVEVIDNGPGVLERDTERLFEPFFSTKASGMGMGLSISRSIVEAHGGEIGYRDDRGSGSIFYFTLPTEDRASAAD